MESKNHQFPDMSDRIHVRYRKAIPAAVAGIRQDPYKGGYHRLEFALQSKFNNFNMETGELTFSYDDDVIEIYSPDEDKIFRQLNRNAFSRGLLVVHSGEREEVDMSPAMSDEEIQSLAGVKNLLSFRKQINDITNVPTLRRVLEAVKKLDRPYSFIRAVEDKLS